MKILKVKRTMFFAVPDDKNVDLNELEVSLWSAFRAWGIVKGLEPTGRGDCQFEIQEPKEPKAIPPPKGNVLRRKA